MAWFFLHNNNSQYLYRNVQFSNASLNGVLFLRVNFWGGRKPECPEETLEVSLRSTETRSTYNIVVEVEGVIDVHYTSLTSQGVQHRVKATENRSITEFLTLLSTRR